VLKPALEAAGFRIDHSEAGLYLWVTEGRDAWETVGRFADRGIVVGPGVFYGDSYPQHVRLSLTATDERIAEAVVRLEKFGDSL
jgi:aspartate/methionine/tyrosine aminotransferase